MPTRTYENIDFVGTSGSLVAGSATINSSGPMRVSMSANDNDSYGPPAQGECSSVIGAEYDLLGSLDFDVFPRIPDNALITKVEIQVDVEGNMQADAAVTVSAGSSNTVNTLGSVAAYTNCDAGLLPDITFQESGSDSESAFGTPTAQAIASGFDHYTNIQTFDYSGAPITKAELITLFTNWLIQVTLSANADSITV